MRSIVAVVGLAVLAVPQDDVVKGWKHPWSGATVGTRLKWKVSVEAAGQKSVQDRTEVVAKVEKDSVTVDEQEGEDKNQEEYSTALPPELEGPWKKTGDEEIKVGDRTFKCAVYEYKRTDALFVQTTKVWKSADAPHWAVKWTFSHVQPGLELLGWTEELVRIEEKVAVTGKEVKCRVVRKTTKSPGIETVDTLWWTDEVPGRVARKTRENSVAGVKAGNSVSELVEAQKK